MIEIPANDKRRKRLKNDFKNMTGLEPVIVFDKEFISKSPRGYMSKYTHYLEQMIINYDAELLKLREALKKKD